jgi:hypothetical protein
MHSGLLINAVVVPAILVPSPVIGFANGDFAISFWETPL